MLTFKQGAFNAEKPRIYIYLTFETSLWTCEM